MNVVEYKEVLLKELLSSVDELTVLIESKKHAGKSKAVRRIAEKTRRDLNRYSNPASALIGDSFLNAFYVPLPEPQTVFRGFSAFINTGATKPDVGN